jgi:hypothetical protein
MRRTSVQPAGGVIVAVEGVTPTEAISTSFKATLAGRAMVSVCAVASGRSARIWVTPASAKPAPPAAVAVFAPVAPAAACSTRLPSMDCPVTLLAPLGRSKDSVMPAGGVHVRDEA